MLEQARAILANTEPRAVVIPLCAALSILIVASVGGLLWKSQRDRVRIDPMEQPFGDMPRLPERFRR